jgi:hypothetical protein
MKKVFLLIISLMFFTSSHLQAQDIVPKTSIKAVVKLYTTSLDLSKKQRKQFQKILKKYQAYFVTDGSREQDQQYNKYLKLETLEIFEILSQEQFKLYKEAKKTIEPTKSFKL